MNAKVLIFFVAVFCCNCIGTDYLEDPKIGERIDISVEQIALKPSEMHQLNAEYFDDFGRSQTANFVWTSTMTGVATVDGNGKITAHAPGQAMITAAFGSAQSKPVNVNVVLTEEDVAYVEIASPGITTLELGQSVSLSAVIRNFKNEVLTGRPIEWFSENSSIAVVDSEGKVTAVSGGTVDIHAKSEGIKSNVLQFTIAGGRSGMFVSAGGYKAVGTATLQVEGQNLTLRFSENFETSFALGTYVYLANSTNGGQVKAGGLEVAQITDNGAKSFNISSISPSTGINDYRYVIILCKPASVTFGYADLN